MAENVEYIDRNKLMAEMQKVRQDLYDGNASPEVVLWWSMAIRIVKLSAAVKAVEKDDARKVEWIPVTPETMPPETNARNAVVCSVCRTYGGTLKKFGSGYICRKCEKERGK